MSKNVKVATFSFTPISIKYKSENQTTTEFMIAWLDKNINQVLPDKPDLIVLPECCDRPLDMSADEVRNYYLEKGDQIIKYLKKKARENHCYIAFDAWRSIGDNKGFNSCQMIDRNGEVIGIYDKNYVTFGDTANYNTHCGEDITIFDCDFGRVGTVVCFDMNFAELRQKYKEAKPDMLLFPSNYHGGPARAFYAFDVRSYLVASCGYDVPGEIISPIGESLGITTNHYNYIVRTVNLDYAVIHLDFNWDKLRAAKEKYGEKVKIHDIGFGGVIMLTSESEEFTAQDIVKEFDITLVDEYLAQARAHREKYKICK